MAGLIRFDLEGGGEVYVEAPKGEEAGALASRGDAAVDAPRSFDKAWSQIRPVTEAVMRELQSLTVKPDEIVVELGVSLKANAGIVIANVATEGSIKVTLKWKPADA